MAFVTTQTSFQRLAGFTPPLILITGTYLSSGGGTGGVVSPGYNNSSGAFTAATGDFLPTLGGRKILNCIFNTSAQNLATVGSVQAFNTTRLRDELTITTDANTGGTYTLLCEDRGQ